MSVMRRNAFVSFGEELFMGLSGINWSGVRPNLISLDSIPFEMEAPRKAALGQVAISGTCCLAVLLGFYLRGQPGFQFINARIPTLAIGAIFFPCYLFVSIWHLVQPDVIKISRSGFEFRTLWREGKWNWTDVRNFRIQSGKYPKITFEKS